MFPKLVALDTDGTIFTGQLDQETWGKGPEAAHKLADNIHKVDSFTLEDRSDHTNKIKMNPDIPRIIHDILNNGAFLAIVSRNKSKALCDRALYYFHAQDPKSGEMKPIIKLVRYDEVADEPLSQHFKRIRGWSKYAYTDMVFFNNKAPKDVTELGVVVNECPAETGLTWETYSKGIAHWAETQKDLAPGSTTKIGIAHFNDVYQVGEQHINIDGKQEKIDVTKFASSLATITEKWSERKDGKKDGLVVFSGDLFSPSTESSITRGKHMPSIINGLGVDVGCVGNHEFDFGVPQLQKLIKDTSFPWLLSNIIDEDTDKIPETMQELYVLERAGVRIGFVGLVEKEWIATVTGWPENYKWRDMAEVGKALSAVLRDPHGEHKCDIVVAVTHSRIPNDIKLARELGALSSKGQAATDISSLHGVDILLGGHDHVYWISKGVDKWEDYDTEAPQDGAEDDKGDTLIVKSGTDFQDLSEVVLELTDTPPGSVRNKVIQRITGKRYITRESTPVNADMKAIIDSELGTINATMSENILITEVQLDVRSSFVRLQESPIGNWIADCIRPAYNEALAKMDYGPTDCVIACCGDFRGDGVYEPGYFTLKNLMTVLPYGDPTIVVELDANGLWDTVESSLSKWPTQEGRFPAISGMRVTWDSTKPGGSRVQSIWLTEQDPKKPEVVLDKEEVKRTNTRKYLVMVGEYMAQGGDGYDVLKDKKQVISSENGQSKSALIRKFLLGAQYLNKQMTEPASTRNAMSNKTLEIVGNFEARLPDLPKFSLESLQDLPSFKLPTSLNIPDVSSWEIPSIPPSPSIRMPGSLNTPSSPSIPKFGAWKTPTIKAPSLPEVRRPSLPQMPSSDSLLSGISNVSSAVQSTQDLAQSTVQTALDLGISTIRWVAAGMLLAAALAVADTEDMGLLDPYERVRTRAMARLLRASDNVNVNLRMNLAVLRGAASDEDKNTAADAEDAKVDAAESDAKKTLPVIHPIVDGRLKDVSKA
ncbi:Metallo-dependent phosphatase [Cylindrobasidium torrendii FP15055 ss-10]|uniref:Metallo-dependent phosphatase n=1 Tax=Cylindrobasidium torrendii FP15055 ss-10 TaxID=1314674 RepID=A0A0D7BTL9_9AGAR|nr:Metallo-dependent phosphatase [Cylindrobasidium torrendii FP15055 ss-10]